MWEKDPVRWGIGLAVILAAALIIRIAWTAWTDPAPQPLSDPQYYNATALSLARGDGYSVVFDARKGFLPGEEETAFWPPGYSAFLAAFYWLFGEGDGVAKAANVLAGALVVVPVCFIGLRLFGRPTGIAAAAIAAALPSFVFWVPVLLSDTLFTLLFAATAALLLHALRPDGSFSPVPAVLGGIALGVTMLVRGQALVLAPIIVVYWALAGGKRRECVLWGCGILALAAVVVAPWSIRNVRVTGSPILLSANLGYNLRVGHAPYSTGRYILPHDLWDAEPEISTFKEREPLFNELGVERAVKYALGHPLREGELAVRKAIWLWTPDTDALVWINWGGKPIPEAAREPLRWALDGSYFAIVALAGCAFVRVRYLMPQLGFLLMVVVVWTAFHVIFFGEPRYHLPLLAVMMPAAVAPLVWLWQWAGRELVPRG
jgi:4-amino-4-deoxy-L-arabinose transferase-like glycosyltransferase